jgi:hypothetical protein
MLICYHLNQFTTAFAIVSLVVLLGVNVHGRSLTSSLKLSGAKSFSSLSFFNPQVEQIFVELMHKGSVEITC